LTLDGNTIADAEQDDLRCVNLLEGASQMAVCAPEGSGVARIPAMEPTDPATLGSGNRIPFDLPLGLISFRLELDQVGSIARVRGSFSEPAPQAAKWIKYDSINGWQDYSAHATFALDRLSVEIEIQDGGAEMPMVWKTGSSLIRPDTASPPRVPLPACPNRIQPAPPLRGHRAVAAVLFLK
jgi:hypothetical protein